MTDTFDPILKTEQLEPLRLFSPKLTSRPGVALVLFREGKPLRTIMPDGRIPFSEARLTPYRTAYHVDVSDHSLEINCDVPCRGDAFVFHARVRLTCAVEKPDVVVQRGVRDARAALEPMLVRTMRAESRRFDLEASGLAEGAITAAIEREVALVGFRLVRCAVELELDESAKRHLRESHEIKTRIERETIAMEAYEPLIKAGRWKLLLLRLAQSPEEGDIVYQLLAKQGAEEARRNLETLKLLLDGNLLEDMDIEEGRTIALRRWVEGQLRDWEPALESGPPAARGALPPSRPAAAAVGPTTPALPSPGSPRAPREPDGSRLRGSLTRRVDARTEGPAPSGAGEKAGPGDGDAGTTDAGEDEPPGGRRLRGSLGG